MAGKLNPKQAIFYGEYIKDGNGTRAAIAAGFPESSAHVAAARLLKNAKVAAAIAAYEVRYCVRAERTADEIRKKIDDLAFHDTGNLYDKNGNRIPVHLLDDVTRAAVSSVDDTTTEDTSAGGTVTRTRTQKVKMIDRLRALELAARCRGMLTDRMEHEGRITLEQLVCGDQDGASSTAHR